MCGSRRPIPVRSARRKRASLVMATFPLLALLRLEAAPDDALAVAGGDVDPSLRIAVDLRRTAAGVVPPRRAVVAAGFRDAVTLLRLVLRWRVDRLLSRK